jgi:hypothetical protein
LALARIALICARQFPSYTLPRAGATTFSENGPVAFG